MDPIAKFMDEKISPETAIRAFTLIIIVRSVLENVLESGHKFFFAGDFYGALTENLHVYLSWLCVFFSFIAAVKFFLRLKYGEALKLVLLASPIICIVPVIDFVHTHGNGDRILYSDTFGTFIHNYINLFNPAANIDMVSLGVRIEIFIACSVALIVGWLYFRRGIVRSLLLSLSLYTIIYFYGYLPAFYNAAGAAVNAMTETSETGLVSQQVYFFIYAVPFIILAACTLYALGKEDEGLVKSVVSFLYPSRILFYLFLLVFGFIFTAHETGLYRKILNAGDLLKLLSAVISITLLFVYSKVINDINDIDIDRISNNRRPLAGGVITPAAAKSAGLIAFLFSLIFAGATDRTYICFWLFIWALSYLYSAPPMRVRRFYPLGHICLSLIGLCVFLSGAALVKSNEFYNAIKSKEVMIYIFFAFFFLSHLKDPKDMEGDRSGGVFNVFNYVGSPKAISVLFFASFLACLLLISVTLEISGTEVVAGSVVFFAVVTCYAIKEKDTAKLDHLLHFSFLFILFESLFWLRKINQ